MYAEPTNLLQKNKRIEERNKVEQTHRDDLSRRIEFVDGGSEGRSQTSVTRALRAAMTSAEFQRRDASRARGPKVSTGMLAHGFVPWKTCRERERERDGLEGYCSRGGRWRGWSTAKAGRRKGKEGGFSHHAQPPARTISNPYLRSATPVERATLVTLPYISFYILFRTALTPVVVVPASSNPPLYFRLRCFR